MKTFRQFLKESYTQIKESARKYSFKIDINDNNKDKIHNLFKNKDVISDKYNGVSYDLYITNLKSNNPGMLNIDIESNIDSDTMNKKYIEEIFKKFNLNNEKINKK